MPDGTYAPQSPDLSSFFSTSPPKQLHPQQAQAQTSAGSYAPHQPSAAGGYAPRSPNLAALEQFSPAVQHPPQHFGFSGGYQPPVPSNPYNQGSFESAEYGRRREEAYLPPIPDLPASHVEGLQSPVKNTFHHPDQYQDPNIFPGQQQGQDPYGYPNPQAPQTISQSPYDHERAPNFEFDYSQPLPQSQNQSFLQSPISYNDPSNLPNTSNIMSSSRAGVRTKQEPASSIKQENGLGPSMGIDVKTKFPVARIKRIMQADEEVGKVAQVTPVAVSKALELFMISLVTKSSALARQSNSKRVTAQHLKKAIESDVQFDFLGEIVGKVVEGPDAGGKRVKDDDSSGEEAPKEKKKRGGGRKKSGAD